MRVGSRTHCARSRMLSRYIPGCVYALRTWRVLAKMTPVHVRNSPISPALCGIHVFSRPAKIPINSSSWRAIADARTRTWVFRASPAVDGPPPRTEPFVDDYGSICFTRCMLSIARSSSTTQSVTIGDNPSTTVFTNQHSSFGASRHSHVLAPACVSPVATLPAGVRVLSAQTQP